MDVQFEALRATLRRAERDGAARTTDVDDIRINIPALADQQRAFMARQLAHRLAIVKSDIEVLEQMRAEYRNGGLDNQSVGKLVETLEFLAADLQSCQRDLLAAQPQNVHA